MPVFDNDPLPINTINAGFGAVVGGPSFNVQIVTGSGGDEQRNCKTRHARRRFRINTDFLDSDDVNDLYDHFAARRGATDSFPFLDPFDYVASGEPIVSGQLVKRYTAGAYTYDRPITLPISGTVTYSGGGSLDYSTGIISGGSGGTWSGEFRIPARYDSDVLSTVYGMPFNAQANCDIIEAWDSDIPALSNTAAPARMDVDFPLSFDLGIDVTRNWSTKIETTGFHEERTQDAPAERNVYRNAFGHVPTEAHLDAILALFLIARGARSGFNFASTPFRFGAPGGVASLILERTGYGTYRASTPLVQLNAA